MSQEIQPALSELVNTQRTLEQMKSDLDHASAALVEDAATLTKIRGLHKSLRGLQTIIRTYPTLRTAA